MDESGIIVRNTARLVDQGYRQEKCIDFDKIYAPVTRLEAIRMLLAFAYFKNFKLYQMNPIASLHVKLQKRFGISWR